MARTPTTLTTTRRASTVFGDLSTEEDDLLRGDPRALAGMRRQSVARGGGAPQVAELTAEAGNAAATAFTACINAHSDPSAAAEEFVDAQFGAAAIRRLLVVPTEYVVGFMLSLAPLVALALTSAGFGRNSRTLLGLFVTCTLYMRVCGVFLSFS